MRILGIDPGERTVGLALSDPLGLTAQPLGVYDLKVPDEERRAWFRDLVASRGVGEIVVGNPLNMDGTAGPRSRQAAAFAGWLRGAVGVPVTLWDERLTTAEARQVIGARRAAGDRERKAQKDREDVAAAVIILSSYLESRRSGAP